ADARCFARSVAPGTNRRAVKRVRGNASIVARRGGSGGGLTAAGACGVRTLGGGLFPARIEIAGESRPRVHRILPGTRALVQQRYGEAAPEPPAELGGIASRYCRKQADDFRRVE